MSLGLYLKGQFVPSEDSDGEPQIFDRAKLEDLERWISNVANDELEWTQWSEDEEGAPFLMVALHPGAEPIMLSTIENGNLLVSAATSSAGPGYHIFVCDLLRKLGQVMHIEWISDIDGDYFDETGYFETGDRDKLYSEFDNWIRSLARTVQDLAREGAKFHMAMPIDSYQFDVTLPILTQMGPRSFDWIKAVEQDPAQARGIFPWWEGGHGAEYYLGRALCHMWYTVRWRPPLVELEAELLTLCLQYLETAYSLDPDLDYPWREWAEIVDYLECECEYIEDVKRKIELMDTDEMLVGYRRRSLRKDLGGGWSIALPGDFVEELEEGQTFLAYDETKNLRVTCMTASDTTGQPLDAVEILTKIKVMDDPLKHERGKIIARAFFEKAQEDDATFWMLRGVCACLGSFAQITICYEDERDRDWALDVWHSLDHKQNYQQDQ